MARDKDPLPKSFGRSSKPKEEVDELEALRRRVADIAAMMGEARSILNDAGQELLQLNSAIQKLQIAKLEAATAPPSR